MKIFLFCNDINLIQIWDNYLPDYNLCIIEELEQLHKISKSTIFLHINSFTHHLDITILRLTKNLNKILVLDNVPTLAIAQKMFQLGVNGYGNPIMASLYLQSAIETINKDMIWLIPELTTQIIKNISTSDISSSNETEILNQLTHKEQEIAILIKEGHTNIYISERLDISINTIKTHIKHIYEKLHVNDKISFALLFK
ncbi:MAG: LuxR C-terminal-related transcriptional regulator [Arcobacteraceae bacterium]|nr:LuxR C-terminal-related transcriptional regulator [Arcobacteraceae bacterium]MDY0327987.1 LuxR C-terminal-related transcriptional regulator [Arcobacteraceae bacterium]